MTPNGLLCAITAHTKKVFIIPSDEVRSLVTKPEVATLLDDFDLFSLAYLRLVRDGFTRHQTLQRLIAIYGVNRTADFLLEMFGGDHA